MVLLLFLAQICIPCLLFWYFWYSYYPLSGVPSRSPLSPLHLYLSSDRYFLVISEPSLYCPFSLIRVIPPFSFYLSFIILLNIDLLPLPPRLHPFFSVYAAFVRQFLSLCSAISFPLLFISPFHPYIFQLLDPFPFPPCELTIELKLLTGDLQWSGIFSLLFDDPIDLFIMFAFPLLCLFLSYVFWYFYIIRAYKVFTYQTCCTCIYLFAVGSLYSMLVLLGIFYYICANW